MQFRTIVSTWFFDAAGASRDLSGWLGRLGVADVAPVRHLLALGFRDESRVVLGGQWGVFGPTWCTLDEVDGLLCLQAYSPFERFRSHADREPEYVAAFAASCERLAPRAALFDARAHYEIEQWVEQEGNRDWVIEQGRRVAARDVNALADERTSILYLSEELVYYWESDPYRDHREVQQLPAGQMFFARPGPYRLA